MSMVRKPVRMKKLRIVLHKDKKEKVLRRLLDEGIFHLESVETEGIPEKAKEEKHVVDIIELGSKIDDILLTFSKLGIKISEDEIEKKIKVKEESTEEVLKRIKENVEEIGKKVKEIYNALVDIRNEMNELEEQRKILSAINRINVDFNSVKQEYEKKFKHVFAGIGVMPSEDLDIIKKDIEKLTKNFAIYSHPLTTEDSLILLVSLQEYEKEIRFILNLHGFKKLKILEELKEFEKVEDAIAEIDYKISELEKEERELFGRAKKIAKEEKEKILAMKEELEVEKEIAKISEKFGRTIETYIITGWVPSEEVYRICSIIRDEANGLCEIVSRAPEHGEKPPTLVVNPAPARPMEVITQAYGVPDYGEYDPTTITAITFPLIFGLMFGDVGQGLVIALIGYYAGFKGKFEEGIRKAARVVMLCGISATFFGFLYGEVFSLEHVIEPLWLNPIELAREDMPALLAISLKLGVLLLSLSLIMHIANEIAHHKYEVAVVSKYGISGLWLLLGGVFMFMRHGLDLVGMFKDTAIIPAMGLPLLIMILGMWKFEHLPFMVSFVESIFEGMIKFVVNTISFMRVVIIAIIHGALSVIMNDMMHIMPATAIGMIGKGGIFLIANIIIIIMEAFVSFIQTMRLHYYELFTKFFSGTGKPFKPLKFIRKFTVREE